MVIRARCPNLYKEEKAMAEKHIQPKTSNCGPQVIEAANKMQGKAAKCKSTRGKDLRSGK